MQGGIPIDDVDALQRYWAVCPQLRHSLFVERRPGYVDLVPERSGIKAAIYEHPEFTSFVAGMNAHFAAWRQMSGATLKALEAGCHPKEVIAQLSEGLLAHYAGQPLIDPYDVYQHLMDDWNETMQDDCYIIAGDGWVKGAQPREIVQVKNKEGKLVWPEPHDYVIGKRRFKSDLVSAEILVAKYFASERDALSRLDNQLAALEQQLEEMRDEHSGEDGLLSEVIEGEGDKQKITVKAASARLKEIGKDTLFADERDALETYAALLEQLTKAKAKRKAAQSDLDNKIHAKYPKLTEGEVKALIIDDKWMARLSRDVQSEVDRVSHALTNRIRELAERYATPLPRLADDVSALTARVEEYLSLMGATRH